MQFYTTSIRSNIKSLPMCSSNSFSKQFQQIICTLFNEANILKWVNTSYTSAEVIHKCPAQCWQVRCCSYLLRVNTSYTSAEVIHKFLAYIVQVCREVRCCSYLLRVNTSYTSADLIQKNLAQCWYVGEVLFLPAMGEHFINELMLYKNVQYSAGMCVGKVLFLTSFYK